MGAMKRIGAVLVVCALLAIPAVLLGEYAYYTWPAVPLMAAIAGGVYWLARRVKT